MVVAVCVDNNGGMLFFGKRQSRDKALIADFMSSAKGKVYIKPFSKVLFDGIPDVIIDNNCLLLAGTGDYCFIEDTDISRYSQKIEKIIVYKWNRDYPHDTDFKMPDGFVLESSKDFQGNSHDEITKEEYIKV